MKHKQAKWTKYSLYAVSLVAGIYLTVDLVQYLEHRSALKTQLERVEQINRDLDHQYQQQMDQYAKDMQQWRALQQSIAQQNQLRLDRWQRNPIIRERTRIETLAREVTPDTDTEAGMVAATPVPVEEEEIVIERPRPPPQLEVTPEPPKPPTRVKVSADSIEFELSENTSWQTIAQLLVLILGLYAGIRIINKFTKDEEAAA